MNSNTPVAHNDRTGISRRSIVMTGVAAGIGACLGGAGAFGASASCASRASRARRPLRIAHFTDIHIQPELRAADGLAMALQHAQSLGDKVQHIVTGGDLIMDGFEKDETRTKLQWELLTKSFSDHCSLPVHHCLGNHDIWGWNKSASGTTGDEARWGKKWALEALGLARAYHATDLGHWRLIVLDSVQTDPGDANGYIGGIDEAQVAWLDGELGAAGERPVMIVSHIPILSVTSLRAGAEKQSASARAGMMVANWEQLVKMFRSRANVKLCLSGHTHARDRIDYDGTAYICDGAVCGEWWKGPRPTCAEGYGVVDLFEDGSFDHLYIEYGWEAVKEDKKD